MVQSAASSVDEFVRTVDEERAPAIHRIRALCQEHLTGWQERMQWGMPGYGPVGSDAVVSFNNQKNYISVYPGKAALEEHRDSLKGASFGGGCVRFSRPDKIDFDALTRMLKHVRANKG
jgi:uncharacterized protein YdhG (YjbR/CyaY superfamily)